MRRMQTRSRKDMLTEKVFQCYITNNAKRKCIVGAGEGRIVWQFHRECDNLIRYVRE